MHGPDGTSFPNESRFVEVVPGGRVVLDHVSGPRFRLAIGLAAQERGTRLTWRTRFETAAECDKVKGFAVPANEHNLDRLQAELSCPA